MEDSDPPGSPDGAAELPGDAPPNSAADAADAADAGAPPRTCLGVLYFSQYRYDRLKPPVCAGLGRRAREGGAAAALPPPDAVPGGAFSYLCVGLSQYDAAALRRDARRRASPADAVQLPRCGGLEVVSAAAALGRRQPGLLAAGGAAAVGAPPPPEAGPAERPGRAYVPRGAAAGGLPGAAPGEEWERFRARFVAVSRRIADKCAANARFAVYAVRKSAGAVAKDLGWDGWGDDEPGGGKGGGGGGGA